MIFLFAQCICVVYCLCSTRVCKSAFGRAVLNHYTVAVCFIVPHASLNDFVMFTKVNKEDPFVWANSESIQRFPSGPVLQAAAAES